MNNLNSDQLQTMMSKALPEVQKIMPMVEGIAKSINPADLRDENGKMDMAKAMSTMAPQIMAQMAQMPDMGGLMGGGDDGGAAGDVQTQVRPLIQYGDIGVESWVNGCVKKYNVKRRVVETGETGPVQKVVKDKIEITIPPYHDYTTPLVVADKGNQSVDENGCVIIGDLHLFLKVKPGKHYRVVGNNIHVCYNITLGHLFKDWRIEVYHPDGTVYPMNKTGVLDGRLDNIIPEKGGNNGGVRGDFVVEFNLCITEDDMKAVDTSLFVVSKPKLA